MNRFFFNLKKLCFEPGFLFPVANVFVFAQSHNNLALGLAVANTVFSSIAAFQTKFQIKPLRVTMWMLVLMALCSFWSGGILPALAGLMFSAGHFLITSDKILAAIKNPATPPLQKVLTHPSIYYGFGSVTVGVMAGGGFALLQHPFDNLSALIMVSCGVVTIIVASFGLALDLFKSNIPFWILAAGVAINGAAGLLVGNLIGTLNCFFAMCGYLSLGWIHSETTK